MRKNATPIQRKYNGPFQNIGTGSMKGHDVILSTSGVYG